MKMNGIPKWQNSEPLINISFTVRPTTMSEKLHTAGDVEKGEPSPERSVSHEKGEISTPERGSAWTNFVDSFKKNPNARVTPEAVDAEGRPVKDAIQAEPALAMKLKVGVEVIIDSVADRFLEQTLANDSYWRIHWHRFVRRKWLCIEYRRTSSPDH